MIQNVEQKNAQLKENGPADEYETESVDPRVQVRYIDVGIIFDENNMFNLFCSRSSWSGWIRPVAMWTKSKTS